MRDMEVRIGGERMVQLRGGGHRSRGSGDQRRRRALPSRLRIPGNAGRAGPGSLDGRGAPAATPSRRASTGGPGPGPTRFCWGRRPTGAATPTPAGEPRRKSPRRAVGCVPANARPPRSTGASAARTPERATAGRRACSAAPSTTPSSARTFRALTTPGPSGATALRSGGSWPSPGSMSRPRAARVTTSGGTASSCPIRSGSPADRPTTGPPSTRSGTGAAILPG